MVRFFQVFPPTVAPIVLHVLIDHGPQDLRWGYLQGLYNFESYWGKLIRMRTRATDPEANIMSVHRMMQLSSLPNPHPAAGAVDFLQVIRNHQRSSVRNLADLFDQSGVISAPKRVPGYISQKSCKYESPHGRANEMLIAEQDKFEFSRLLLLEESDMNDEECKLRQVKLLEIGGVARVPRSKKNLLRANTVSHDFQQLSTRLFGTILEIFHVTVGQVNSEFIARANIYSKPKRARRSRLPVIRNDVYQQKLIRCADVGKLVVLATAKGPGDMARRVVLPNARGYGEELSNSNSSDSSESSE